MRMLHHDMNSPTDTDIAGKRENNSIRNDFEQAIGNAIKETRENKTGSFIIREDKYKQDQGRLTVEG